MCDNGSLEPLPCRGIAATRRQLHAPAQRKMSKERTKGPHQRTTIASVRLLLYLYNVIDN